MTPTDATALHLVILAVVGVAAGWINTIAGAGSLLLLPALMFTGLDASEANATNRIGILATSIAAVAGYRRAGISITRSDAKLTGAAAFGGAIGAFVATLLDPREMRFAIVIAMGVMLVLSLWPKPARAADAPPPSPRLPAPTVGIAAAFVAIGIYGGFLQAGVGIILMLYLSLAHGVSLVASNVVKSTVTLSITVIAIVVFAARGERLDLVRGGVLAVTSAIGGLVGAKTSVAMGEKFVRTMVTIAVVASMIRLLLP